MKGKAHSESVMVRAVKELENGGKAEEIACNRNLRRISWSVSRGGFG